MNFVLEDILIIMKIINAYHLKCDACLYNRMVISILIMININYNSSIIINIYMNECIYKLTYHFFVRKFKKSIFKIIFKQNSIQIYTVHFI
jgi:hypothetical protein